MQFQLKHKSKSDQTPVVKVDQINEEKISAEMTEIIKTEMTKDEKQEVTEDAKPEVTTLQSETSAAKRDSTNVTRTFLRPSPSETSFTRSRSLEFPAKPKHSPDCKDNPCKL